MTNSWYFYCPKCHPMYRPKCHPMVEKGNKRGICHAIHLYAKANNKYMKDYNKNKERL